MKLGIITFHRAENFGAIFQCYALQTYLTSLGHTVEVIDYRCKAIEQTYDIFNPRIFFQNKNIFYSFRKYVNRIVHAHERFLRKKHFNDFRKKYLFLSKPHTKIKCSFDYDCYIVGSDQVWNLNITKGFDNVYFLDFKTKEGARKISYAASSEVVSVENIMKNKSIIKKALEDFDDISVREKQVKDILCNVVGVDNVKVSIDPTFLIDKRNYIDLTRPVLEKKYVLVYHLTESPEASRFAERIAQKKNLRVIEIHAVYSSFSDLNRHKMGLGPEDILSYIYYADSVVTTSFHGMALSLILQKNFYVMRIRNIFRMQNLLSQIGLEDRILDSDQDFVDEYINYDTLTPLLDQLIIKSKNYLKSIPLS